MSTDLRVAVVGAGIMGADHIQRITRRIAGARVSAVVEPDANRAAAAALNAPGAAAFANVSDAIATGEIDAVLIATPGQFHASVLQPALAAGLPILCEKPLTQDPVSSLEILRLEQQLDRPHIQVGFMRRFDVEYQALRDLVVSGDSGDLLMVHALHRNPSVPPGYTQDMLITDSVVHEFDVVPWLAGSPIVSVEVKRPRSNSAAPEGLREPILVLIELANGVLIDVEMNVRVQFGYQVATEAVFERGIARIGQPSGMQRWDAGQFRMKEHETYTTRFAAAYDTQIQRWVDAVRRGDLVDGPNAWDGYLAAVACEAGLRALRENGQVAVVTPERPAFYA